MRKILMAFLLTVPVACLDPLDVLGNDTVTTVQRTNAAEDALQDDRIEDKHPVADPNLVVTETFGPGGREACALPLNKSASVTKLDVVPLGDAHGDLKDKVFSNRSSALGALVPAGLTETALPSIEVVNGTMKPFNDGVYASIETNVEQGLAAGGSFPSRRQFLKDLLSAVQALRNQAHAAQAQPLDDAASYLGAALKLAGESPTLTPSQSAAADLRLDGFRKDPAVSRAIGFYTWTPELTQIFQQDRFLQNYAAVEQPMAVPEVGQAAALALALKSDATLTTRYQTYLALYAGLTNPSADLPVTALDPYVTDLSSLDDLSGLAARFAAAHRSPLPVPCAPVLSLFPASHSKETDYFNEQTCRAGEPATDFMTLLINAIQSGEVDLAPSVGSGWYDYQSAALETLLLPDRGPESNHLLLTAAYKKKLINTFKSLITQNRETHVKQLKLGGTAVKYTPPPADVYPQFPVEPFPTFYLRSARAYRFLSTYLAGVLGPEFLAAASRMREDGSPSRFTLGEELRHEALLMYGLYLSSADSTGLKPELLAEEMLEFSEEACRAEAADWLSGWATNPDVNVDSRVIVPVQLDSVTDEVVYWAVTGVKIIKAHAEFVAGHEPTVVNATDTCFSGKFVPHDYYMAVDVSEELRLPRSSKAPTRAEFRAACDKDPSVTALQNALR